MSNGTASASSTERTLLVFQGGFGLPSISPFSTKAMILLHMAGLDHTLKVANPTKAPKKKLPVLLDGNRTVPDSHFIRLHVEKEYGVDFDRTLDKGERAAATAFTALVEDRLYWIALMERWAYEENRASLAQTFDNVPAPLRGLVVRAVRGSILRSARAQGVGRHSREEALTIGQGVIDALATQLGEKPFLMGADPTSVDASAYSMLIGCRADGFETRLRAMIEAHPTLVAYCERMKKHFPLEAAVTGT